MAEEVSPLMKATVLMRQPGRVQEIVGALRRGGRDRLQVISDFDRTLSRFAYNGKPCPSSYNILDNSKIISEECREKLKALLHQYYPIEIDPRRTAQEKSPHMVEWWTKAHDLLCQQKIQKSQIAQVVRESNAMLREGYKAFFNTLYQNNIPLFIFSAGIGDILEEIIRQMKVFHPNIHIVSNYMDFDEDGFLQGFKGQLIHTYNKNSSVCKDSSYFQQLQGKTNVVLLGDTMGDLTMADGVPGVENILKIGFLNDKVPERQRQWAEGGAFQGPSSPLPGRWRSSGSATWPPMTLCWRRTRRWTWSTGCCSTSCTRGTGWRCRAPECAGAACLQAETRRGPPWGLLCGEPGVYRGQLRAPTSCWVLALPSPFPGTFL
ncbi:7-methylguanosine phosphate-specific 5'-nucleotidase isoform X1 [Myotis daubentonii]|uniref:7-methylguanosine phosphate-specific 5'-nucleotidase isoform X1 n=1 Tax=Myotis daubentonii TaxID=98922 RepID=UPI002873E100|nr:7-methylguanosine phosphate-specific 5'-nucleotidase isoform X1 [Myotis daubentonii]